MGQGKIYRVRNLVFFGMDFSRDPCLVLLPRDQRPAVHTGRVQHFDEDSLGLRDATPTASKFERQFEFLLPESIYDGLLGPSRSTAAI